MRVMNNIRLTNNQGRVLARIIAAPSPQMAAQEISDDQNMVAARNELMSLGLLTLTNGSAEITDKGMTVATQENIVDETGELSQKGQDLAFTGVNGEPDEDNAGAGAAQGPLGGVPMEPAMPPMEGYRTGPMLKELFAQAFPRKK